MEGAGFEKNLIFRTGITSPVSGIFFLLQKNSTNDKS